LANKANKSLNWITPVLDNDWSIYTDRTFAYSKDDFGIVRIFGAIRSTQPLVSNGTIFTLPEGFRPSESVIKAGMLFNKSTGGNANLSITMTASGIVRITTYNTSEELASYSPGQIIYIDLWFPIIFV